MRSSTRTTRTRTSGARCRTSAWRGGRTGPWSSRRRGPSTTMVRDLRVAEHPGVGRPGAPGLRRRPSARPLERRHTAGDPRAHAGGHPALSRRALPPRQHGNGGGLPFFGDAADPSPATARHGKRRYRLPAANAEWFQNHSFYKLASLGRGAGDTADTSPSSSRRGDYEVYPIAVPTCHSFCASSTERRGVPVDPRLVDYAVANTFYARQWPIRYEQRARAIHGWGRERPSARSLLVFRTRWLRACYAPDLADAMHGASRPSMHYAILLERNALHRRARFWFAVAVEAQPAR